MDKNDLKSYIVLKKETNRLRNKLLQLEMDAKNLKAVYIDGMPKSCCQIDAVGNLVAKLEVVRKEYILKYAETLDMLIKIEQAIDNLDDPTERLVLRKRYIDLKPWASIGIEMGYNSSRNIFRIHSKALKNLAKI